MNLSTIIFIIWKHLGFKEILSPQITSWKLIIYFMLVTV